MALPVGSVSDYLSQTAASDVAGLAGLSNPLTAAITAIPDILSLTGVIPDPISALVGSLQGRPTMQATQQIASYANSSNPVLATLGAGAAKLAAAGIPISSPQAGAIFGPYFEQASQLENTIRWGPGATSQAQQLTAQTLANALGEMGGSNGSGTSTIQGMNNAYSKYQQSQGGGGGTAPQPGAPAPQSVTPSLTKPQLQDQQGLDTYAAQYANYVKGGGVGPPPTPPQEPADPTVAQYQAYEGDYANYVNNYANYQKQLAASAPQAVQPTYHQPGESLFTPGQAFNQSFQTPAQKLAQLQGEAAHIQDQLGDQSHLNKSADTKLQSQYGNLEQQIKQLQSQGGTNTPPSTPPGGQPGQRPPNCPPCPGGGGGGQGSGGGGGQGGGNNTGGGNNNLQELQQLIQQLQNNPSQNPLQIILQYFQNLPNGEQQLGQLLGGLGSSGTGTGTGSGSTTGKSTSSPTTVGGGLRGFGGMLPLPFLQVPHTPGGMNMPTMQDALSFLSSLDQSQGSYL